MDQQTRITIMRLSRIFRRICAKVLDLANMGTLREYAAITMCMLEMTKPPSFFDIMVHLILHQVDELDMCGPIHTRWMYCVERLNKVLKRVCTEHGSTRGFNGNRILNGWDIRADHRVHGSIPTIKEANMGFERGGRCLWGGSRRCIHSNRTHSYTTKHGTQLCFQQHKHHGPLGEVK